MPRIQWSQISKFQAAKPGCGKLRSSARRERFAVLLTNESNLKDPKGSAHVTFLLNFFDELRRRAPAGGK
jgi:hypothetical protein